MKLPKNKRRGLTLLELVIVLAILAALAGLLLPLAGTYLEKAHAGACATNHKEVAKLVQQYNTVTRAFPDTLDSLVDGGALYTGLPGDETAGGYYLSLGSIDAAQADALIESGITSLMEHDNADPDASATFNSTATVVPVADTVPVANIDPVLINSALGTSIAGTDELVVFGLGHDCSIVGEWLQEAPYHFPEEGNPNSEYNRFALVFNITDGAEFVGVISMKGEGIEGIIDPLSEFFEG